MSAQDNLERVLRDIHVLVSKSEMYDQTGERIIVEKRPIFELLRRLNTCIYEMMEEYEVTKQSRFKAEREAKKQADQIVWNATRNAEDVYAAAVLYTDEALSRAQDIMKSAEQSVRELLEKTEADMKEKCSVLKENQSELKSQLQDMVDTEKYLKLIEERNKEIEKEKREKEEGKDARTIEKKREKSLYDDRKTEIKVNPEYFEKIGRSLEENPKEEALTPETAEKDDKEEKGPQITVNLDAEYFKWKKSAQKNGQKKVRKKQG